MRRVFAVVVLAAAVATTACRDLHLHIHLPPRQSAGAAPLSVDAADDEAPRALQPTPAGPAQPPADIQTPEEILDELILDQAGPPASEP